MTEAIKKQRPQFRNINAFKDLTTYRLPAAGWVSILHRVSGAIMFLLLPFIIWLFDTSVSSEISFTKFSSAFLIGIGILPAWFIKLVVLALIWSFLHHLIAGVRHLYMDTHHAVDKDFGRNSARLTLGLSWALTVLLAAKLFGIY
jgi:succinate dehydrogenase / fumarate reductase cytochrome b subunit